MKKLLFFLTFLFIYQLTPAQSFHVATYNIRLDVASDGINQWSNRKSMLSQLIRFHRFDVFGTQEGFKHQLEDLQKDLPTHSYVGVGRDDGAEKGEYAAIFYNKSLFNLAESGTFWLSTDTERPNKGWDAALPRICTWATLTHRTSGTTFLVMNIHFDHVGVLARSESAKLLLHQAKTLYPGLPLIVMGDFNVDQHDESYALLHQSGVVEDAFHKATFVYAPTGTFTGFDVKRHNDLRIDHIFVSKHFQVKRYGILTDTYGGGLLPSDHYPVWIEVAFPN
jgi:endonuclease/exonuclease/phosphatase family metal-dependent hydrolase